MKKIKKIKSITHIYTDQYDYFGVLYIYIYIHICRTANSKRAIYMCNCGGVCVCKHDVNKIIKKKNTKY